MSCHIKILDFEVKEEKECECRLTLQKCNDRRVLYLSSHWFPLGFLVLCYTQGTQVFVFFCLFVFCLFKIHKQCKTKE